MPDRKIVAYSPTAGMIFFFERHPASWIIKVNLVHASGKVDFSFIDGVERLEQTENRTWYAGTPHTQSFWRELIDREDDWRATCVEILNKERKPRWRV